LHFPIFNHLFGICQVVLHHSNIDLESQLRQQTSSSSSSSTSSSSKRYHSATSPVSSTASSRAVADPEEGESLAKAKSTITKQAAEILSLKNQVLLSIPFTFLKEILSNRYFS